VAFYISKFIKIYFCNNDIAFVSAFGEGSNMRNLTISLSGGLVKRIELLLSGRSSELFSPGRGWDDVRVFGVLVQTWLNVENTLVVGNVGGGVGVQRYGADLVGVEVFW
jgi:alpha-galactosidase